MKKSHFRRPETFPHQDESFFIKKSDFRHPGGSNPRKMHIFVKSLRAWKNKDSIISTSTGRFAVDREFVDIVFWGGRVARTRLKEPCQGQRCISSWGLELIPPCSEHSTILRKSSYFIRRIAKVMNNYENVNISLDVYQKSLKHMTNLNISLDVLQKSFKTNENLNISLDVRQKSSKNMKS